MLEYVRKNRIIKIVKINRIKRGESMKFIEDEHIELKENLPSDLRKEVVAFANTCDGTIYIGVKDNGQVIGVTDCDEVIEKVSGTIRNSIKPDVTMYVNLSVEQIDKKNVVVIKVNRGASRPYYIYEKGLKPTGVYVRQGASSVPASEEHIRKMIKETDGDSFEKLRSLNQNLTFNYAQMMFDGAHIAFEDSQKKTLGIIGEDNLYTNLGLLLSDQCSHTLKLAIFEGKDKTIFKDRKEFSGSLLKQVTDAFEYIDLANKTQATIIGLTRIDERDYPIEALREALLNSVVHREYSFSGSTIINIYEDRMEFVSLGGIVSGLSLDDIMLGVSQSRNAGLANIFYRLHLIESYGTGIQKILKSYENSNVKPEIISAPGSFKVVLPNIHSRQIQIVDDINLSENEKNIIHILKQGDATRKEIEDAVNLSQTKTLNLLNKLISLHLIEKIGKGKNTRYKVI